MCAAHGWLRSGNTSSARGVVEFLREALALLPPGWRLRTVRADSGFFDEELLEFLEERGLSYVIVARLTQRIKQRAAALQEWTLLDEHYAVGEFRAQLLGWKRERRFVVVRERVREEKEAVGRKLLEVPDYRFRIFVTNRAEEPLAL
ncbi:MAG: transposase [Verrucomicrobia bacterium]|nr:transposase [Verrucomicrobiota bacterium]